MESRFIKLPTFQSVVLANTFEAIFEDIDDDYLKFVEADEIFYVLIGGDLDQHLFPLIERSCKEDTVSYLTAINLSDWLEVIREEAEKLEYYEICHNCLTFRNELENILNETEHFYSRDCRDLSECDH